MNPRLEATAFKDTRQSVGLEQAFLNGAIWVNRHHSAAETSARKHPALLEAVAGLGHLVKSHGKRLAGEASSVFLSQLGTPPVNEGTATLLVAGAYRVIIDEAIAGPALKRGPYAMIPPPYEGIHAVVAIRNNQYTPGLEDPGCLGGKTIDLKVVRNSLD